MPSMSTKFSIIVLVPLMVIGTQAYASQAARDRGPAPSAAETAACKGHQKGELVTLKLAQGKSVKGVCRLYRGTLAWHPARGHKKKQPSIWSSLIPSFLK